jgi:hypothetical protein
VVIRRSSFVTERDQRIDLRRFSGGEKASGESNRKNAGNNHAEGPGIGCRNAQIWLARTLEHLNFMCLKIKSEEDF